MDESGGHLEHEDADIDRERLARTLRDLADVIDMAGEVTSRTRAAFDADITLRLAGEAIVSSAPRCVRSASTPILAIHPAHVSCRLRRRRQHHALGFRSGS